MRKCKLCGGKAEILTSEDIIINKCVSGYTVVCSNIGCPNRTDWFNNEYQAISAWQDANIK